MSTTAIKLIAGAGLALFILVLVGILSFFAYHKLTPIDPVVYVIMGLITTLIGMLTALAGHASATAKYAASAALAEPLTTLTTVALPAAVKQ